MIVFVTGLVGTGKSSVAKLLADAFSILHYDVDEVKKEIYPHEPDFEYRIREGIPFPEETRLKVYQKVVADIQHLAKSHRHLIVEECLHLKRLRKVLLDAAETYFGGYVIVWVKADEAVILDRLRNKERKDHILTDPLKMYRSFAKEFEGFEGCYIVCENNGTLEEAMGPLFSMMKNVASLRIQGGQV